MGIVYVEERQCIGCGRMFRTADLRKARCTNNCRTRTNNNKRTQERITHLLDFIGVDGEGVTRDTGKWFTLDGGTTAIPYPHSHFVADHDYVLLSVGSESLYNVDGSALQPDQIFSFLWDQFIANPKSVFVGFYLNYDYTMWLRYLPEERAAMLLTERGMALRARNSSGDNHVPFPVRWGHWEFDLLAGKRFKLRRGSVGPWLYINDTGGFWQSSFMSVINPKVWPHPVVTDAEYETIKAGKKDRATAQLDNDMIRYNVAENAALDKVTEVLNKGFSGMGIRLKRNQWFGPGQLASAWLDKVGAPTSDLINEITPDATLQMAQNTYYGGRFEIAEHGLIEGLTYEYDINSAYPFIIANLPCLLHGSWVTTKKGDPSCTMILGTITGSHPKLGALPFREADHSIHFPHKVRGWYWQHEIDAGIRAGLIDTVQVEKRRGYVRCGCLPPLRTIAELYQERLSVGKNSPEGKARKLLYNSAYGKFAQSIGSPKYANPIYASLITSGCRTQILDAIASHPNGANAVRMIATDGIYFDSPHPNLDISPETLGLWDEGTKKDITLYKPGVYWDDKARQAIANHTEPVVKSRGISARDLGKMLTTIDAQWADTSKWPEASIPVGFLFTSATLALARNKWAMAGMVQTDTHRLDSSNPVRKRRIIDIERRLTAPYPEGVMEGTTIPYAHTMGMDYGPDTIDGPVVTALAEIWRGE